MADTIAEIEFLDPKTAKFNMTDTHILTLEYEGEFYPCVQLHRSFPYTNPDQYISIRDDDDSDKDKVREIGNDKKKEIGMIRDLNEFDPVTKKILEKFLDLRYFAPAITKVLSIREEFGYRYWDVETDKGPCKFITNFSRNSIITVGSGDRVMIFDVDGNRFQIPSFAELDTKARKQIEMYM